jgi:hypothetical protein
VQTPSAPQNEEVYCSPPRTHLRDDGHSIVNIPSSSHEKLVKIFVADPEDGGYTYDLLVNPNKTVSSLRRFVEARNAYDILCDNRVVVNDTVVTIGQVTGGTDGAFFTFQQRQRN